MGYYDNEPQTTESDSSSDLSTDTDGVDAQSGETDSSALGR